MPDSEGGNGGGGGGGRGGKKAAAGGRELRKAASAEGAVGQKAGRKPRKAAAGAESVVPAAVQEADCYHGMIHKDELGSLLLREGDYVIRLGRSERAADRITLSVFWDGGPRHFILESIGAGARRRVWVEPEHKFGTETGLVNWYMDTGTPMGPKACVLRNPVPHQSWELDVDNIVLEKELGAGAFGKVFRGSLDIGGGGEKTPAAIKQCESSRRSLAQQNVFMKEAEIGRRLCHRNVIRIYGVQCREHPLMIVMEFAGEGSLLGWLRRQAKAKTAPAETTMLALCKDAVMGVDYLHQQRVLQGLQRMGLV